MLHKLEPLILHPNESKCLTLTIDRKEFAGVVRIAASEAAGLRFVPDDIVATADHGTLDITVEPTAALGLRRVTVTTTAEGQPAQTMPLSLLVLPPGYTADDRFETSYPTRIVRPVEAEGKKFEVVCVLLRPKGGSGAPFYLMENKVCNGVFGVFCQQDGAKLGSLLWRRGGVANGRELGVENDFWPVLRVTRSEAERCALWLGGRLPSARQLDEAAGLQERPAGRDGPARGPAVAVNRAAEGPQPINSDSDDISLSGIRDLAGNGREWTRDCMPLPDGTQAAILRGRSYTAAGPLRFTDVEEWNKADALCPTQFPEHASPYTGFRVVIELPGE